MSRGGSGRFARWLKLLLAMGAGMATLTPSPTRDEPGPPRGPASTVKLDPDVALDPDIVLDPDVPVPAAPRRPSPTDRTGIVWRAKWWILGVAIAVGLMVVAVCYVLPRTYESSATLRVIAPSSTLSSPNDTVLAS